MPTRHNGRPIISRHVETGYLDVDTSSYIWGAVLNDHYEARCFLYNDDHRALSTIPWRTPTLSVKGWPLSHSPLLVPMLRNSHIRMHEDNHGVIGVLTKSTSCFPHLMAELRKQNWYLMDTHGITPSAMRYIGFAVNIWADRRLSCETDRDDWRLNPRRFALLTSKWKHAPSTALQRPPAPLQPQME